MKPFERILATFYHRSIVMSWKKCLLCGFFSEENSSCAALPCCSWCAKEAETLHPDEAYALLALEQIRPHFTVWKHGRRQDSPNTSQSDNELFELQPARIFYGLPLYIGDIDNAADVSHLKELKIRCVVIERSGCEGRWESGSA